MKSRRQSALTSSLSISVFCAVAFFVSQSVFAQKPKPSPSPAKDLLTVEPVRPQAPPVETGKPDTLPDYGQQQKPGTDVDEKTPVITNTDLITFTVTVTDLYGRFVSGLNKTAFTILDDKQPQEISFFSDDDSPVSVGVIFDVSGSF